jgi:hypothetical protein
VAVNPIKTPLKAKYIVPLGAGGSSSGPASPPNATGGGLRHLGLFVVAEGTPSRRRDASNAYNLERR